MKSIAAPEFDGLWIGAGGKFWDVLRTLGLWAAFGGSDIEDGDLRGAWLGSR